MITLQSISRVSETLCDDPMRGHPGRGSPELETISGRDSGRPKDNHECHRIVYKEYWQVDGNRTLLQPRSETR